MSAEQKKYYGSTFVLLALGVLLFYGGTGWLVWLAAAAALVWYAARREPAASRKGRRGATIGTDGNP
jgi:type IV secretory pathway TrbD component